MVAIVTDDVEASFPNHHGRPIQQVASGSQFTVSAVELVINEYGRLEEQITLCINECNFESTTQMFKLAGDPKPVTSHPGIKHLHKTLFSPMKENLQSRVGYDGALDPVSSHGRPLNNQSSPETQSPEHDTEHETEDAEMQSQFATQLPVSRKRKRASESRVRMSDNPPVDVQKENKRFRQIKNDLYSLIPGLHAPKRANIEEVQQGTRDTSEDSDEEEFAEAVEKQPVHESREQSAASLPGEDEKQSSNLEKPQKMLPLANVTSDSNQQHWHVRVTFRTV